MSDKSDKSESKQGVIIDIILIVCGICWLIYDFQRGVSGTFMVIVDAVMVGAMVSMVFDIKRKLTSNEDTR